MSYQDFLDTVLIKMKELYSDCLVEITNVTKNNGVDLKGLIIRSENHNLSPTIYLESFYKLYQRNVTIEEIVSKIQEIYENEMPANNIDISFFQDFEKVKDRIVYRLINAEKNEKLLQNIPHIRFWDLAICFVYAFWEEKLGSGTILIRDNHAKIWNVDTKCLMALAEINTPKLFPAKFFDIMEILGPTLKQVDMDLFQWICDDKRMYVLTNENKMHGSATILYPQVLSGIADMLKCDFFILPSSLHEVLILPVSKDETVTEQATAIREMVKYENETQLEKEEILTNNPFYYGCEEKQLKQL